MTNIKESLMEKFQKTNASPFLFVGSGFSRRYIELEDWKGLLRRFTKELSRPFEYYLSASNSHLPKTAELIGEDFHTIWWEADSYRLSREQYKTAMTKKSSPLRVEICEYLKSLPLNCNNPEYIDEFSLIGTLNVDGIITTNWDQLIETLFPKYKSYIGQQGLLFSNPQSIGEIYKIHGCCTDPSSLILTEEDYTDFNEKNVYLAAKLITIFVEHPVIFIGYSLEDPNITLLLSSIAKCIGKDNINKLGNNLIFIKRPRNNESDSISDTFMSISNVQIPVVLVTAKSFIPIYEAISETKRKMPVSVLRFFKEQLYEMVRTGNTEGKITFVVDIEKVEEQIYKNEKVEFVIGVGAGASEIGYRAIKAIDLFKDVLDPQKKRFSAQQILETTVPALAKQSKHLPVYNYLSKLGITTQEQYENSSYKSTLAKCVLTFDQYKTRSYETHSTRPEYQGKTAKEIIEQSQKADFIARILCSLEPDKDNGDAIRDFLLKRIDKLNDNIPTDIRKLCCYYDKLMYGWW